MPRPIESNVAGTRWAVRITPFFILGAFGFATYAVVAHACVDYLLREKQHKGLAIAFIVLHFVFLVPTLATYARTFLTTQFDPGLVPLPPGREAGDHEYRARRKRGGDAEAQAWAPPDENPDSPGLEAFYSKSIFICECDGRPLWCSECRHWKPDRARHSRELGRCVRKMDHLCPWVGGMVSETSFNFFVQFNVYCSFYCALCLAVSAYCLAKKKQQGRSLDGVFVALIALAGFFLIFTLGMTITTTKLVFTNTTSVDILRKSQVYQLAVRVGGGSVGPLSHKTITYPLARPPGGPPDQANGSTGGPESDESARDQQATHTFVIFRTEPGENPWDLGYWQNFKSVMGNNALEWFLPIRRSPCSNHESMDSDYPFGPLLEELVKRRGIKPIQYAENEDGDIEMGDLSGTRA